MDIVYFMGPAHTNELKYSLRSVCKNVPHDNVWFFGEPPDWVENAAVVDAPFDTNKYWSLHSKFRLIANPMISQLSDKVMNFDDDMYVMEPFTELPAHHIAEEMIRVFVRIESQTVTYNQVIDNTWEFLDENGVENPKEVSIHTPRVYEREKVAELIKLDKKIQPVLWRKIYANYFDLPSIRLEVDVKVIHADHWKYLQKHPQGFLSSFDKTFNLIEDYLEEEFPDKCDYEA